MSCQCDFFHCETGRSLGIGQLDYIDDNLIVYQIDQNSSLRPKWRILV